MMRCDAYLRGFSEGVCVESSVVEGFKQERNVPRYDDNLRDEPSWASSCLVLRR